MKCKYPESVCGNMTVLNGVAYCDSVPCSLRGELPPMTNADRLRELAQADKDGRCVVLPCKLGDTIFVVANNAIKEMEVKYIQSAPDGSICMQAECTDETEGCYCNGLCAIKFTSANIKQRNIHFTREAAEAALRREQKREKAEKAISAIMPSMSTPDGTGSHDAEIWAAQEMCVDAMAAIHNLPAADVVEVVRCRECEYWRGIDEFGDGYCVNPDAIDNIAKPDDFCSYGTRKEG